VVFWFLCEGGSRVFDRIHFRVVDERGVESNPYFDKNQTYSDGGGTEGYYVHAGILPRRSREIRLRVLEDGKQGKLLLVGEFQIPNPLYGKYPEWTAEPLPATRRFGEMAVTLEDVNVTLNSSWTNLLQQAFQANVARIRLRTTESNQLTDEWAFFGARCSDATADFTYDWYTPYRRLGPGDIELTGRWPVWLGEKTAKLQTLWVRREIQPPERVITFYGVPLPAVGQTTKTIARTNHPLGELRILCRPGKWPPDEERYLLLFSSDPRFYQYQEPEVESYFFQAARDEHGKELERIDYRTFRVPSGVKSVDMAIHLPEAKRADFMVSPRLISINATLRRK
jgi:hypothetical protein